MRRVNNPWQRRSRLSMVYSGFERKSDITGKSIVRYRNLDGDMQSVAMGIDADGVCIENAGVFGSCTFDMDYLYTVNRCDGLRDGFSIRNIDKRYEERFNESPDKTT